MNKMITTGKIFTTGNTTSGNITTGKMIILDKLNDDR
jgi:hypothetical protein